MVKVSPTRISEDQYKNGVFAKDPRNGNEYFMWSSNNNDYLDQSICVGCDDSAQAFKDWNPLNEKNGTYVDSIDVLDENGEYFEIETAWICETTNSFNDLNLEKLAKGEVEWI